MSPSEARKLEEVTVEETGEFIRARLREAYFAGAGTMLVLSERLARENPERSQPIWSRLRAEVESADGRQTLHG